MSADIDAHNNEIKNEFSDVENADENLTKSQYNNSNSKNNANNNNVRSDDGENFIDNDDLSDANNGGPDSPKFIRLRGLPWSATHQEILDFLKGVSVVNGSKGIHLVTSRWDGKNTGEAYVEVETQEDVEEARKLNKALMEHRYIEVFSANSKEAKEAMRKTGSHSGSYVVKLRGLPYAVTEKQIEEFFSGLEIKPDREGILFVMDRRGRATGEAFVQFETHDDTEQALGRNREKIGHRYIEIFRSSIAELKRAAPGNGRPVPYDIKDRGSNRGGGGGFNDYNNVGRNNSRDPWNHSNFNMGANNTLGFNSPTNFTNSGNFGNVFGPKNNLSSNNGNGGIFGHINNNNGNNNMNNSGGSPNGGNFGNFPNFSNNGNFGHTGGMNNNNNNNNNNNGPNNNNNNIVNSGNFGNFNNNNNNGNNVRSMMGGTGMIGNGNNNSSGFSANNRFNNGNGNFGNDFGDFNNFGNQRNFNGNNFGNNNMNDFVVNRNNNNNMGNNNNNNNFGNFGNDNSAPNNCGNFNNGGCNYGPVGGGRGEFFTIHMRGMPYSCFENDVYKFFDPIRPVNVRINFNKKGLHSGTADVFFDVYEDAQLAMKRHREQMGSRYIELFFDGKTKGPPNNNFNNNNSRDNDDLSSNNNMMRGNNSAYNFSRRV